MHTADNYGRHDQGTLLSQWAKSERESVVWSGNGGASWMRYVEDEPTVYL